MMSSASNTVNMRPNGQSGEILELRHRSRKPRILIGGEFSAGKSTLINALLGEALLPQNVTATALPPMWIVSGRRRPLRFDREGKPHPLVAGTGPQLHETSFCLLSRGSALLDDMDLIDTPGHSDPNMPADYWERMVGLADAVVWCSNAVQAWRQSELAIWQSLPRRLTQNALLILSHADRLIGSGSGEKVVARVQREAGGLFGQIRLASLVDPKDILSLREDVTALAHSVKIQTGAPHPGVDAVLRLAQPAAEAVPKRPTPTAATEGPSEARPVLPALDSDAAAEAVERADINVNAAFPEAGAEADIRDGSELDFDAAAPPAPAPVAKVSPRKPRGPRRSGHQRPEPEQLPEVAALPVTTEVVEAEIKPFAPLATPASDEDDTVDVVDEALPEPVIAEPVINVDLVAALLAEDRAAVLSDTAEPSPETLAAPQNAPALLPVLTLSPIIHGVVSGPQQYNSLGQRRIARDIWDEIARDHDMSNPSAILACVMHLLSRVDNMLQAAGVTHETEIRQAVAPANGPYDAQPLEGTAP